MTVPDHKLRTLLCHAFQDRARIEGIYQQLNAEQGIEPWLAEQNIADDNQLKEFSIRSSLRDTVIIFVFLSNNSVSKEGVLEPRINHILDILNDIRWEPTLVIPVRLEECPIPKRLKKWKCWDLYSETSQDTFQKLLSELRITGAEYVKRREIFIKKEIKKTRRAAKIIAFLLLIRDTIEARQPLFRTKLRVLICHSERDLLSATEIHEQLKTEPWMELRRVEAKKGSSREWDKTIRKTVRSTDVVLMVLSHELISQDVYYPPGFAGIFYRVKERNANRIFVIPIRVDDSPPHVKFQLWRWLDYFSAGAHDQLLGSLYDIARVFGIPRVFLGSRKMTGSVRADPVGPQNDYVFKGDTRGERFIKFRLPSESRSFLISQRLVTCSQYERFLRAPDHAQEVFWRDFPKYDETCKYIGSWDNQELERVDDYRTGDRSKKPPYHWVDASYTLALPDHSVNYVSWYEANAYCKWLTKHWRDVPEFETLPGFHDPSTSYMFRLPLRTEWVHAIKTGGTQSPGEYVDAQPPDGTVYIPSGFMEWLANQNRHGAFLERYYGVMYVDDYLADMARIGYDHSTSPSDNSEKNGFRVVAVTAY